MPFPSPPVPLKKHCTCLFGSQLFAYTGKGFYRLDIKPGGNWTELESTVNAQDAACLHLGANTPDEAFYVIGGSVGPNDDLPKDYAGLMRYRFNAKTWDILPKQDKALFNLTGHGVTFMNKSNQLMVFAGAQWPNINTPSSQMFLVSTEAPFGTVSEPTGLAPPLLDPIVLQWGNNGGIVMGGDVNNRDLFTFNADTGWAKLNTSLPDGMPDQSVASAIITNGDDGSRTMFAFDFQQIPTQVTRMVLRNGTTTSSKSKAAGSSRIQLTSSNWPAYNGTLAPRVTRKDFSIAQNKQWAVVSGGNDEDPLCIFDYRKNTWLNATALLTKQQQPLLEEGGDSSSTVSSTISTPTSTDNVNTSTQSSSTSPPFISISTSASPNATRPTTQLLFIILGVVVLAGFILGAAYLLLRRKRKHIEAKERRNGRGSPSRVQSALSIQDRGIMFNKEVGGGIGYGEKVPENIMFPTNNQRTASIGIADGSAIELQHQQRGSGWSRYFSGNSSSQLVNNTNKDQAQVTRSISNASKSTYSMSSMPDEYDMKRASNPTIGYIRSSNATSSAILSARLPTPVVANVQLHDRDSYQDITSHHNSGFNSSEPFWSPVFPEGQQPATGNKNSLWYARESSDMGNPRASSGMFPPRDPARGSAMTIFPGGTDSSNPSIDFMAGESDVARAAAIKEGGPPANADNLNWFNRF